MFFVKRNHSLTRYYSPSSKKIRRKLVNLYRPYDRYSDNLFLSKIDLMAYIMISLFGMTALLFTFGLSYDYVPFLVGFISNVILFAYFYAKPLTWEEMEDYEKTYYRQIFYLPKDWYPTDEI